jgi:hypothetical protein
MKSLIKKLRKGCPEPLCRMERGHLRSAITPNSAEVTTLMRKAASELEQARDIIAAVTGPAATFGDHQRALDWLRNRTPATTASS